MCLLFWLSFFVFSSLMKCVLFFYHNLIRKTIHWIPLIGLFVAFDTWFEKTKQMNKYIYYKCIHCSTESVLSLYTLHTYIHTNNIRRPLQGVVAEWMVLLLLPWRYCAEIIRDGPSSVLKQLESRCPWMLAVSHGLLLLLANIDRAASCSNSWATPWFFCSVDYNDVEHHSLLRAAPAAILESFWLITKAQTTFEMWVEVVFLVIMRSNYTVRLERHSFKSMANCLR